MVKVGLASYPLPVPPKGMERLVTGEGFTVPLRVAVALGDPPTGLAPPKVALGGLPAGYEPPAVTLTVLICLPYVGGVLTVTPEQGAATLNADGTVV